MSDQDEVPPPVTPNTDIGPYYKFIGGVCALGAVVLLGFKIQKGYDLGWIDVGVLAILAMLVIALIRPQFFDSTVKTVADKLPFTAFRKTE